MYSFICYIESLKSTDTAKYFQNGLAEIVEIRHTVRSVEILSSDIFVNLISLKRVFFCEFSDVTHAYLILTETL
jgi:hypothetical protein